MQISKSYIDLHTCARVHEIFQPGGCYIKPKFWKGVNFLGEFSDIIAFLLPNIFGKASERGKSP